MKVLLLTQWFEPEPTFKGLTFAKALRDEGLDVEVLTGFPNYPVGKIYPGYKVRLVQHEVIDGIKITRVPLYPSHDRSVFRRIANYLSFSISAFIYALLFFRKVDVVYAYHPPLSVGVTAVALKLLRGWRVVLDVQDLWPDTLRATGMVNNERLLSLIGRVAQSIYRLSDCVVVLSNGFKGRLVNRCVPVEKIQVIHNWADEKKLSNSNELILFGDGNKNFFNILFAGNIGAAQSLSAVLEAANILKKNNPRVRFIFLGTGLDLESLKVQSELLQLDNVQFLNPVPMERVGAYLNAADALLVHLKVDELFEITIPSKIQAYMSVGKPILMSVQGEAAELVNSAKCGIFASPENPVSLARAAEELANLNPEKLTIMGNNGQRFYEENLSLRVGAKKFKKVFESVI